MSKKSKAPTAVAQSIRKLIDQARKIERREQCASERYSFFRPVSIKTTGGRCYSAFSREISMVGIGLLHNMPLTAGQVECRISSPDDSHMIVPLNIIWCEPCGEGWYISGGEFVPCPGGKA